MTSNPFSARFIRPGAIPFVYPEGQSAATLLERLRETHWYGQIIGPHGSGKSTLLAALLPELEAAGRKVISITLRQGEGQLPPYEPKVFSAETQLVIDGYEQLSGWSRWRATSLCRRQGAGLLVTAHENVGLPLLYRTEPTPELVRQVVNQLLAGDEASISSDDVGRAFQSAAGNIRETLFKLYDVYQSRVR